MNWTLLSEGMFQTYQLADAEKIITTLKCNRITGSIRLEYEEKRLFFMHQKYTDCGIFSITNEYGYEIGLLNFLENETGTIQITDKIFFFIKEAESISIFDDRNELLAQFACDEEINKFETIAKLLATTYTISQAKRQVHTVSYMV